jgi:hypothetical protein
MGLRAGGGSVPREGRAEVRRSVVLRRRAGFLRGTGDVAGRSAGGVGSGEDGGGGGTEGPGDAWTWPGVASRLLEVACEDWGKLARVCVLLLCVAVVGVAWWLVLRAA